MAVMIEKGTYVELAKANAEAIQGLQPKISVWNTGAEAGTEGGSGGNAAATSTMRNIYQMLPPLMSTIVSSIADIQYIMSQRLLTCYALERPNRHHTSRMAVRPHARGTCEQGEQGPQQQTKEPAIKLDSELRTTIELLGVSRLESVLGIASHARSFVVFLLSRLYYNVYSGVSFKLSVLV